MTSIQLPNKLFLKLLPYYSALRSGLKDPDRETVEFSDYLSSNDVVIEVGANMGAGSLLIARKVKRVYAFEPNPYSFSCLRFYTRHVHNIVIYNYGVGEVEKEADLNYTEHRAGRGSSLKELKDVPYSGKIRVKLVPLDTIRFDEPPTALFLDCEGYEVEALRGADRILKSKELRNIFVDSHQLANGEQVLDSVKDLLSQYSFLSLEGRPTHFVRPSLVL